MRVAVIHNLRPGGARRTVEQHLRHFDCEVVEFCLSTATPVSEDATVIPVSVRARRAPRALRPPLRHTDLLELILGWRRLAQAANAAGASVMLAHPCQFLQAPAALLWTNPPSIYFCHEPRRIDYEAAAAASVNPRTAALYCPLRQAQRWFDRRATCLAGCLLTNSRFTARRIHAAYGRVAVPVPMGAVELFRPADVPSQPRHLLSVGALLPSKGHDLAIRAAAEARTRRPVVVVAPRPDGEEEHRLRTIATQVGVQLEVRVAISDAQLRDLYRTALATLYLATEEPLGLVALEAQATGCPVILADEGGLPETLIDGTTGWVVPRSPSAAAQRLDDLENPRVREPMSRAAAQHGALATWRRSAQFVERQLRDAAGAST